MDPVRRPPGRSPGRPRKPVLLEPAGLGPRRGLHDRAVERLRALIVEGTLPAGAALVETELSAALGISRTPVREALKLLAVEGLVELRPNRSPRVAELRPDAVAELFEAIAAIERACAELAASRIAPAELERLRRYQSEMEAHHAAGDLAPYFALNQRIHALIVACAGNRPLREAHEVLHARAEIARRRALDSRARWDESVAEHRAILAALEARDAGSAGRLLADHVGHTGTALLAGLAKPDTEPGTEPDADRHVEPDAA
ncbi:GntR family transcriptional regulator [Methylobacterium platani]|uniref:Transcriptional regulator n=1 Tax=Methylobacterium platani TaxID=427683 RepID=A0A179S4A8_9HYPH|nr:GntR family transcriptional regulator [Methylobacterium platani]OAS18828.1 transcriptional regulator [Methylobacterium platani]